MSTLQILQLDLNNEFTRSQYEQALFQAFSHYPEDAFDGIWEVNHTTQRAVTLIPYAQQRIVAAYFMNDLVAAAAINVNIHGLLQLESFGFNIAKEPGAAEALVLFSNQFMIGREIVMAKVARECKAMLREMSVNVLWASCEKKHVRAYVSAGFSLCEVVLFHGREVCLLRHVV